MPTLTVRPRASARSTVRSLARLWPWARPVRGRLAAAAFLAAVASVLALVMPLVLKWVVDGPVAHRDPAGVWLGGGLLLVLGAAEAGIFGVRRWLVARPLAGVEARMRQAFYQHVQRFPVAAHERWSSGQLLSRSTTDLRLLHGFLAVALPFLVVNAVTLVVGCVILLAQQWLLGLLLLAPVPVLLLVCALLEARYAAAARQAQDQVGEVATAVQESIWGIRVIKGLGHHREQARRFRKLGPPAPCHRAGQGAPAGGRVGLAVGAAGYGRDRGADGGCGAGVGWDGVGRDAAGGRGHRPGAEAGGGLHRWAVGVQRRGRSSRRHSPWPGRSRPTPRTAGSSSPSTR